MKVNSTEMIDRLQSEVREMILEAGRLRQMEAGKLQMQPGPGQWSIAQVLAHLNSYGNYYLPAIEKAINDSKHVAKKLFKPGLLGGYFTNLMAPGKDGNIGKKMKAPKDHRPTFIADSEEVILEFIEQQQKLLELLQLARRIDLGRARVPISIAKFIRLKLGDTFGFLVAHERRHFVQIANLGIRN